MIPLNSGMLEMFLLADTQRAVLLTNGDCIGFMASKRSRNTPGSIADWGWDMYSW